MSHYHFAMNDGLTSSNDDEGCDHLDEYSARRMVLANAREMLADGARAGLCRRHWVTDVTDSAGNKLFSVPFADAVVPGFLNA